MNTFSNIEPRPYDNSIMALYVVSTPIGNLEDITARALRVLQKVGFIACEDTRHTHQLLNRFNIHKPLIRYDEHVHHRESPRLLKRLCQGEDAALVTDAGTPGVSDPGARLLQEAVSAGVQVIPIPGPSSVLAALIGSGLPTDEFTFLGFLSRRPGRMARELKEAGNTRTLIFFESVFRLKKTLETAQQVFGDVPAAVGRELTKIHEEFIRGSLSQVLDVLSKHQVLKGEATVVLAPQLKSEKAEGQSAK